MKKLLLILLLSGCSVAVIGETRPPSGEEAFSIFLSKASLSLEDEPLCKADIKLYQQLALSLSVSHETNNTIKIASSCAPSKFENAENKVVDIWDCKIQISEENPEGEFVSNSTYVFGVSWDRSEYVEGSLRCI